LYHFTSSRRCRTPSDSNTISSFSNRLLLVYGSLLVGTLGQIVSEGDALDVQLTPSEVQAAVKEAVGIVREQIEVVEPHVFQSGESVLK
ncbi:hypothetical protein SK128_011223, partial [Halocaridina rubra]